MQIPRSSSLKVLPAIILLVLASVSCDRFARSVITDAVLSNDVQPETTSPIDISNSFPADQKTVHAVVSAMGAPAETSVKVVWVAVNVGTSLAPNSIVDEAEVHIEGTGNFQFQRSAPGGRWPQGEYKAELYVSGKLDKILPFTIGAVPPTPRPTATPIPTPVVCPTLTPGVFKASGWIENVVMAEDVDKEFGVPISPTSVFKTNSTFHAVVTVKNAPANTQIRDVWYAANIKGTTPCNSVIEQGETVRSGSGKFQVWLDRQSKTWPIGEYRLEIFVNGKLDKAIPFSVR